LGEHSVKVRKQITLETIFGFVRKVEDLRNVNIAFFAQVYILERGRKLFLLFIPQEGLLIELYFLPVGTVCWVKLDCASLS
jgi:hypothetical protein